MVQTQTRRERYVRQDTVRRENKGPEEEFSRWGTQQKRRRFSTGPSNILLYNHRGGGGHKLSRRKQLAEDAEESESDDDRKPRTFSIKVAKETKAM